MDCQIQENVATCYFSFFFSSDLKIYLLKDLC